MKGPGVLATCFLLSLVAFMPASTGPAFAAGQVNAVGNADFEKATSWTLLSGSGTYGGGTVTLYDTSQYHSISHSAKISAPQGTTPPGTDSVRATFYQFLSPGSYTLNCLSRADDSFSAWWYVVRNATTAGLYAVHASVDVSGPSNYHLEYFYGTSDLANSTSSRSYNLGPVPTDAWFQMRRNLLVDLQDFNIASPSAYSLGHIWFGAFGNSTHGETAWVDDVAISFDNCPPLALFSASTALGTAPLNVTFTAQSTPSPGSSIREYRWNFGDGTSRTVSTRSTSHVYQTPGTYRVVFTVVDASGLSSSSSLIVTVNAGGESAGPLLFGVGGLMLLVMGFLFFSRKRRGRYKRAS